jgi:hypothetical protein
MSVRGARLAVDRWQGRVDGVLGRGSRGRRYPVARGAVMFKGSAGGRLRFWMMPFKHFVGDFVSCSVATGACRVALLGEFAMTKANAPAFEDLCQLKHAGPPVTSYNPKSLGQYACLCADFPAPVMTIGTANLYRKSDLAAWSLARRARTGAKLKTV